MEASDASEGAICQPSAIKLTATLTRSATLSQGDTTRSQRSGLRLGREGGESTPEQD